MNSRRRADGRWVGPAGVGVDRNGNVLVRDLSDRIQKRSVKVIHDQLHNGIGSWNGRPRRWWCSFVALGSRRHRVEDGVL